MEKQYGASLGGPIVRDLLQFFVSYEAKDFVTPSEVRLGENVHASDLPPDLAALVRPLSEPFKEDLYFGKLTWTPGDVHLFELTTKYRKESDISNVGNGPNTASFGSRKTNDEKRVDLRYQYTGNAWLNDAHLTYEDQSWNPRAITSALGYRLVTPDRRTILNTGGGEDFQDKGQKGYSFQDDFTYTGFDFAGAHTIKTGLKYKKIDINAFEQQPYNPQFFYDIQESYTIPNHVEFGQTVPGVGSRNITSRNSQFGIYLQDDWEVSDKLTLNLGLRWDYEETPSYLNYVTRPDLVAALHNWANIQHTDYNIDNYISNGHNRSAPKDEWQPRLGFSYDLNADQQHVIFGGVGRAYDRNLFDYLALERSKGTFPRYGFDFNTAAHPCAVGTGTCLAWDPAYFDPANLAALVAGNPNLGGEVDMINNNIKTPYSDQFSLGMRNALGDWNSSVSVVHIESHDGIVFTLGNRYPDGTFRPAGTTWGGQPWGFGIPGFGQLILADNGLETRLNSLLLSLDKPYTRDSGWGVTVAYTFSAAKENRPNVAASDEHYVFDYPNVSQVGWHRSVGIPRHRLVVTGIIDGPLGVTYSAKGTLASATTLDATNCHDAIDFNHCFFDPLTPSYRYGLRQLDLAASKEWNLDNKMALRFRVDILNVFNRRNYTDFDTWRGGPAPDFNPTFGQRNGTGIVLPTRTIKLAGGFSF
jgi:outer membrane receptor protein involved in Fe transport